jgi:hypothetical protein
MNLQEIKAELEQGTTEIDYKLLAILNKCQNKAIGQKDTIYAMEKFISLAEEISMDESFRKVMDVLEDIMPHEAKASIQSDYIHSQFQNLPAKSIEKSSRNRIINTINSLISKVKSCGATIIGRDGISEDIDGTTSEEVNKEMENFRKLKTILEEQKLSLHESMAAEKNEPNMDLLIRIL